MKNHPANSLRFIPAALGLAVCLLANNAMAQSQYFGVGGTLSWDDPNWSVSGGTSAGPFASNWTPGDFARFYGAGSYAVTVNNSESMSGMVEDSTTAGAALTINAAGSGNLSVVPSATATAGLFVQGFFAASGQTLTINAPISGSGGVSFGLFNSATPTVNLYGNNTYSGGTVMNSSSVLMGFNNNSSFGTGPIVDNGTTFAPLLATGGSLITLANNFSMFASGGINFASAANTPVRSTGTWSLGANNLNLRNNGNSTAPLTLTGVISGTGNMSFSGANGGTISLSGANTYSGTTTVGMTGDTAIRLTLAAANTIASSSQLIMFGGTVDPAGQHHTMTGTTLALTGNSAFDFTSGAAEMDFAKSAGVAWTAGKTLNLVSTGGGNWNLSSDYLEVGTDGTGLTTAQLAEIEFNGADLGAAGITSTGYIYDTAQVVPEPSTVLLGLLGGLGVMSNIRRRRTA